MYYKSMIDLEEHFQKWRAELVQTGMARVEVLDELENHLRERTACLINSGASETEAFWAAVQELGESRILKREFAKLNGHWFWGYRDNPASLKILAAWFVLMGLTGLLQWHPGHPHASMGGLFRLDAPLQVLIGLGLLDRRNAWRFCAFGWAAFNVALYAYALTPAPLNFVYSHIEKHPLSAVPLLDAQNQYAMWLGLPGHVAFIPIVNLLGLAVSMGALIWACVVVRTSARPDKVG